MKEYYRMTPKEVCKALNTNEDGLTEHRAEQIIKEKGLNVLSEAKKKKPVEIFFSQFADLLVIILIIAAVISAFFREHRKYYCYTDSYNYEFHTGNCAVCQGREVARIA